MNAAESKDIFHISERMLAEIRTKLKDRKDVVWADIFSLAVLAEMDDEEIMVPVDMRGAMKKFDDNLEKMVEELGAKGAAQEFVKAADFWTRSPKTSDPNR